MRFLDLLYHALLPVFTLTLAGIGPYIYVVRTIAVNIAQSDHVTVARAKGLSDGLVSRRHILRVAAPPIVTGLVMGFAGTLGGSILVETVFNWQGMGRLYYEAIAQSARAAGHTDARVLIPQLLKTEAGCRMLVTVLGLEPVRVEASALREVPCMHLAR